MAITFWYDFSSSYTYLSAMRIEAMFAERGVPLRWRPFALGPIFAAQGWRDSPFNIYKAKGANMWRDMERECAVLGLPQHRTDNIPQHTMLAVRVACHIHDRPEMPD